MELDQRGWTWALPNLLLGSLVIVPVWFLLSLPTARRVQRLIDLIARRDQSMSRSVGIGTCSGFFGFTAFSSALSG